MTIKSAMYYNTDRKGHETSGPGYPMLRVTTDAGDLIFGPEQKLMRYGYEMAVAGVAPRNVLSTINIGPDDDVAHPPGAPMEVENATVDPVVVAIVREFLRRTDAGEPVGEIPVPNEN